jgi:hypothetical protein
MLAAGSTSATSVSEITFDDTENETECPLTRTLEVFDEDKNIWITVYDSFASAGGGTDNTSGFGFITNVDTTKLSFDVQTDSYSTYDDDTIDPTVIKMRQTVSDPASGEEDNMVSDEFDVTLKYECYDDVLTLDKPLPSSAWNSTEIAAQNGLTAADWGYQEY